MIDKNGRLFGKLNIFDGLVILVVLAVLIGAVYKFSKTESSSPFNEGKMIEIQFVAEESPDFAVNSVKIGDVARDFKSGVTFGKVTSIKVGPPRTSGVDSKGNYVESAKPFFLSGVYTVEGIGSLNSTGGATFQNSEYLIGRTIELKLGNAIVYARVFNIAMKG